MITYNHEKYIGEAIEGVLRQECDFECELIIADDASQDQTGEIVKKYIDSHPRGHWIKYTRHEQNKGMMGNFVWALKQCKGKYIALCEGDDFWIHPNKIQIQVDFLIENLEFSMTFHDANYLYLELGRKFSDKYDFIKEKQIFGLKDLQNRKWFIPTASIVFRKFHIPNWMVNVKEGDFTLHLLLSNRGNFFYFPNSWSVYRIHIGGQSRVIKTYKNRLNDIKIWFTYIPNINPLILFRWYFSNWWRLNLQRFKEG